MLTTEFNPRKSHCYTKACVNDVWQRISHFDLDSNLVWLIGDGTQSSGFVDVDQVITWERAEDW